MPSPHATPSPWKWEPIWAQSVVSLIMFQIVWGGLALGALGLTLCRPSSLLKRQQHLPCTVFTPCWLLGAASWGGHTSHPVGTGRLLLNAGL